MEVVVTICIIVLVSSGLLNIFGQSFHYIRRAKDRSIAYDLAQGLLENASGSFNSNANISKGPVSGFNAFSRSLTVTAVPWAIYDNVHKISATVWWNADSENITLETFKARF